MRKYFFIQNLVIHLYHNQKQIIMRTILGLTFATLGLSCESTYLALLCAGVCLVLIVKSK